VGGHSLKVQEADLRARPEIVVCTPGRLIDLLRNAPNVHMDDIDILILDEADRLLEMGFRDEVEEIVKHCPINRQTVLLSATMVAQVKELINLSLKKPVRVSADPLYDVAQRLSQEFVRIRSNREGDREAILVSLITRSFKEQVIVFCPTKKLAHRLTIVLGLAGVDCGELHGDLTQQQRLDALNAFKEKQVRATPLDWKALPPSTTSCCVLTPTMCAPAFTPHRLMCWWPPTWPVEVWILPA